MERIAVFSYDGRNTRCSLTSKGKGDSLRKERVGDYLEKQGQDLCSNRLKIMG